MFKATAYQSPLKEVKESISKKDSSISELNLLSTYS